MVGGGMENKRKNIKRNEITSLIVTLIVIVLANITSVSECRAIYKTSYSLPLK